MNDGRAKPRQLHHQMSGGVLGSQQDRVAGDLPAAPVQVEGRQSQPLWPYQQTRPSRRQISTHEGLRKTAMGSTS